jgi:hypothetical protein
MQMDTTRQKDQISIVSEYFLEIAYIFSKEAIRLMRTARKIC